MLVVSSCNRLVLAGAVVITVALAPRASRADDPHCSDVPRDKEDACRAESKAKCGHLRVTPRLECEGKIARSMMPCLSADYEAMCTKVRSLAKEVCREPRGLVLSEPKTIEAWKARVERLVGSGAPWKAYKEKYGECYRARRYVECDEDAGSAYDACEAAPAAYKKTYAEMVDSVLNSELGYLQESVKNDLKRESFHVAAQTIKMVRTSLDTLLAIDAAVATVRHRSDELKAAAATLTALADEVEAARVKVLAARRCPAGKAHDKKLLAKLKPVLDFKDTETMKETALVIRMNGKPVKKVEPLTRVTHEDAPLVACVKQVKKAENTETCRIFFVTARRSKVGSGKWGDWAFYSIGGGDEMLCENVK